MTMKPITLRTNGIQLTLLSVERGKTYNCGCEPGGRDRCKLKTLFSFHESKTILTATEVFINVQNRTGGSWEVRMNSWELVNSDGLAYYPDSLCLALLPPRALMPGSSRVTSGTQADFILIFQDFDKGQEIAQLRYTAKESKLSFEIKALKTESPCFLNNAFDRALARSVLA